MNWWREFEDAPPEPVRVEIDVDGFVWYVHATDVRESPPHLPQLALVTCTPRPST